MILSEILSLNNNNNNSCDFLNEESIMNFKLNSKEKKLYTLNKTLFSEEISIIDNEILCNEVSCSDLVILSEPKNETLDEHELNDFLEKYTEAIKKAEESSIKIVHIVTNTTWFGLFNEIITKNSIPVYLTNDSHSKIKSCLTNIKFHIIEDFLLIKNFNCYSNKINNNLLIDLTSFCDHENFYTQTINYILTIVSHFNNVTILISEDSYFPVINNEKVRICSELNNKELEECTYVLVLTNTPYETSNNKVLYYAANSKVVFANYNFKLNNMIPSVILNLTNHLDVVKPLNEIDAFEILNENRNTVLYNHSTINLLEMIFNTVLDTKFVKPLTIDNTLDYFEDNLFMKKSSESNIDVKIMDRKYDIEKTIAFPMIFLGFNTVQYKNSYMTDMKLRGNNINISIAHTVFQKNSNNSKFKLSIIVPIHNNGKYLKYKCFRSLKSLSRFNEFEIIFIDDGSDDPETLRIIDDLVQNNDIKLERYQTGSGSASRPRNRGVYLASTELITFLDPDNEAIDNGHSVLLDEMLENKKIDMVVGDIVREDNNKRNTIRYSNKVKKAINTDIIENTKEVLIKTNLTVQSIQGLIVKRNLILDNNIQMVEGAAGQDTLYFQELLLNCSKVKVVNHLIHSYYAYVEGSVTNTVSYRFFEKFFKVEIERLKFLIEQDLIEHYMKKKFNFYFRDWYISKYNQVPYYEKEKAYNYLKKIYDLYIHYKEYMNENIVKFIEANNPYNKESENEN